MSIRKSRRLKSTLKWFALSLAFLAVQLWTGSSRAQEGTGGIAGVVRGKSLVPGYTVRVTSDTGLVERTGVLDANLEFSFGELPPGGYVITVDIQIGSKIRHEVQIHPSEWTRITIDEGAGLQLLPDTENLPIRAIPQPTPSIGLGPRGDLVEMQRSCPQCVQGTGTVPPEMRIEVGNQKGTASELMANLRPEEYEKRKKEVTKSILQEIERFLLDEYEKIDGTPLLEPPTLKVRVGPVRSLINQGRWEKLEISVYAATTDFNIMIEGKSAPGAGSPPKEPRYKAMHNTSYERKLKDHVEDLTSRIKHHLGSLR